MCRLDIQLFALNVLLGGRGRSCVQGNSGTVCSENTNSSSLSAEPCRGQACPLRYTAATTSSSPRQLVISHARLTSTLQLLQVALWAVVPLLCQLWGRVSDKTGPLHQGSRQPVERGGQPALLCRGQETLRSPGLQPAAVWPVDDDPVGASESKRSLCSCPPFPAFVSNLSVILPPQCHGQCVGPSLATQYRHVYCRDANATKIPDRMCGGVLRWVLWTKSFFDHCTSKL